MTTDPDVRRIRRIAFAAFLLNLALAIAKFVVSRTSGSLALGASVVDSASDSVASLAVFAGVVLSTKKTERFPLGLYKIENVISVVVAIFIFIAGYEIARSALTSEPIASAGSPAAIWVMLASTALIFAFGRYALYRGKVTGSPALIAEGHHRQADVLSSLAVLAALVADAAGLRFDFHGITVDRIAAIVVLVFVVRAGWGLLNDGMRVLLDATLPPEQLGAIRDAIVADASVVDVRNLYGRSAGRFLFVQATVGIRGEGLERAHAISHRIEGAIREAVPHVARVIVHYEPARPDEQVIALPVDGTRLFARLGKTPEFLLVRCRRSSGEILSRVRRENPHRGAVKRKGVVMARWLVAQKIDVLLTAREAEGASILPALENSGVVVARTALEDPEEALADYLSREA